MQVEKKFGEEELVQLLKQRNKDAISYLYDHYSPALYSVIVSIIPDRDLANDILQEVFIKIWRQIETYDAGKGRLFTWMMQVTRNTSLDVIRSKSYKTSQKNLPLEESVYDIGSVEYNPDRLGLRKLVYQLKQEHRQLLELAYFQGFTHDEIAQALDIPLGTVKTRLRNALIQLRILFKQ